MFDRVLNTNRNKTKINSCFLSTVHDRTPRLYRKCVYLTLKKIETNLNYDYLTKIGNPSGLPELICLATPTGSASETQNAESYKTNRFTNIL